MSDDSGSYMRFTSDHSFPSTRPHNKNLARMLVQSSQLSNHIRNIKVRVSNPQAQRYKYKRTMFDRVENNAVGGSFLNKKHPRLARDPTWYPGRGQDKAVKTLKKIGMTALEIAPELLLA